jgi:NAD(P)-dependent dehydrogenase (short-subunit alcohol dehydrogenase family)
MANLLEGKVIAMTGAGRGIGRECALLAASEGARIVVNDPGVNPDGSSHDDGPAAQVVDEIKKMGGEAVANFADVSSMEGGESVIKSALDTYGRLDGLINLAAILRDRMVFNMTEEEWDLVIKVDLKGHFTTLKPASVLMRQQRFGRIVNYSSVSGLQGNSGQANYGAAKAGASLPAPPLASRRRCRRHLASCAHPAGSQARVARPPPLPPRTRPPKTLPPCAARRWSPP